MDQPPSLFRDNDISALDRARQIGPLNRYVVEVHRDTGAHQRIGLIAYVKVKMRLG